MSLWSTLARPLRPATVAYAHCDIPCGIYHPGAAQLGAETVERMTTLIQELGSDLDPVKTVQLARYTHVKEEHAEIVKHEVRIIWGDYFKPEHLEKYPELHTKVWNIMKVASQARQGLNMDAAKQLRGLVDEFAEIFWETKR